MRHLADLAERAIFPDGYLELQPDSEDFLIEFQRNLENYTPVVVHGQPYPLGNVYTFDLLQRTYELPKTTYFCDNG
jgi:hypothetical protein